VVKRLEWQHDALGQVVGQHLHTEVLAIEVVLLHVTNTNSSNRKRSLERKNEIEDK